MSSVKSILLERFDIVFKNRIDQNENEFFRHPSDTKQPNFSSSNFRRLNFLSNKNAENMQKLEQRIEGLEIQNDQLICFINFLLDNLPDLVSNILQSQKEPNTTVQQDSEISYAQPAPEQCCQKEPNPQPTRRERDILELLGKGLCAKEIADKLFISESTVITHKKNLKEKFNAKNTVELISKAQSHL